MVGGALVAMFGTTPTDPWMHWRNMQAGQADASSRPPFVQSQGSQQTNPGFTAAAFASSLGSSSAAQATGSRNPPTSAFNLLGKNAPPASAVPQQPTRQSPDQLIASPLHQALAGEKRAIPSWNGSPSTLRSWLKLLAVWEFESTVPMDKRGIKLLQSFPENSQPRRIADTVPVEVLLSPQGYGAILAAIRQKYQPFLEASAPHAIDVFLFEGERAKGESFSSFIATKQLQRQEMESQLGERISDRLCGRILLKQANLNELQREMVSLRGPVLRTFDEVANMLRPLDSSDEDEEGYPYVYFEDREHDELEAVEIMAYHAAYRDVRRELQKRKNERGYVSRDRAKGSSKGSRFVRKGKGKSKGKKGKISFQQRNSNKGYEDDLEQRTRCWNCQELGHFSKNCPLSSRGAGSSSTSASTRRQQQFVVNNGQQSFATQQYMQFSMRPLPGQNPQVFMRAMQAARISVYAGVVCTPGEALVDTAAEEAVIGTRALQSLQQELKKHGLQTLKVDPLMPLPTAGEVELVARRQWSAWLKSPSGLLASMGSFALRF